MNISTSRGELVETVRKQNKLILTNIPENESTIHFLHFPSFFLASVVIFLFCPQQGDITQSFYTLKNIIPIRPDCCNYARKSNRKAV